MSGSRFARSRAMQVLAWLVCLFCITVTVTGVVVSKTKTSHAQDGVTAAQTNGMTGVEAVPSGVGGSEETQDDTAGNEAPDELTGEGPAAENNGTTTGAGGTNAGTDGGTNGNQPAFTRQVGQGDSGSILDRGLSIFGIFFFIGLAFLMSTNRKAINWTLVAWGVGLQLVFALIIFFVPGGEWAFDAATKAVDKLLQFTNDGSSFIFQSFVTGEVDTAMINFAFAVLPTIIFFSSLMTILYHIGIMQRIVYVFALLMQKTMGTSGAESLSAAANIFVGQTEAPLVIKPYVDKMTVSELMTVMTGGFATVAGGVMAIYVGMLKDVFPDIAGHLIAASVMSAPAALVIGKIMIPEENEPDTSGDLEMSIEKEDVNVLDAASRGAAEGLKLALNVGAMLLAFLALISLVNYLIGLPAMMAGFDPITLQEICAYLFAPIAFVMGVPWDDCFNIGRLLGVKMVVNELVAYAELQQMLNSGVQLQDRSIIIATYALCGFANFGSIGIQLGGIGGIAPSRKHDLAKIAFRAMIAGTIAAFMTATIAGILV